MRGHARDGEAVARHLAERMIVAAAPVGIGHHGLASDLMEGDVLRGMPGGRGDRHGREHAIRVARGPFQHLHAAHRPADDAEQLVDAEMVDEAHLRIHHVADGDDGEIQPVWLACVRVDRCRTGRAHAAAENVWADDEVAVGIDRLAGADKRRPPTRLLGYGVLAGDVLVAGQGMADEDGVRLGGIERAIGLVGNGDRRQELIAGKPQRLALGQAQNLARRPVGLDKSRTVGAVQNRHGSHGHGSALTPSLSLRPIL